jgi:4'-phosphopantetheinyl transferase
MNTTKRTTLSDNEIHVWRFPLIAARQEVSALAHWLSEQEMARLNRMCSPVKRGKRIIAWGRLRYVLSRYLDCSPRDIQISHERGRPEIMFPEKPRIRFNLSHSGRLGMMAISRHAVGIDIERVDATLGVNRLAMRFFTFDEARRLRNLPEAEQVLTFFRLWVLKEAHLKTHGAQVPAGLSRCELVLTADGPYLCRSDFEPHASPSMLIEIPTVKGYAAALSGVQESAEVLVFDL